MIHKDDKTLNEKFKAPEGWRWQYGELSRGVSEDELSLGIDGEGEIEVSVQVPAGWDGSTSTDYHTIPMDVLKTLLERAGFTLTKTSKE